MFSKDGYNSRFHSICSFYNVDTPPFKWWSESMSTPSSKPGWTFITTSTNRKEQGNTIRLTKLSRICHATSPCSLGCSLGNRPPCREEAKQPKGEVMCRCSDWWPRLRSLPTPSINHQTLEWVNLQMSLACSHWATPTLPATLCHTTG